MLEDDDLDAAVEAGLIDPETRARLDAFATERRRLLHTEPAPVAAPEDAPRFDLVHVLYYAGALLVIGAMGLLADAAFQQFGGWALTAIAALYGAGFFWLGRLLWKDPETHVPGGLCVAVAVAMAPAAVYGALVAIGFAQSQPALGRIAMEIAAIAAGALAMRRFPFPFLLLIVGVAGWMLATDVAALIAHGGRPGWDSAWELRRSVTQGVGVVMILAGWAIDLRNVAAGDFGFWPHALGSAALWGATTLDDDLRSPLYCAFSIALIALGLFLGRRVYALFGGIGVAVYLGVLAFATLRDTFAFAVALSVIGVAVVLAGLVLERNRGRVSAWLDAWLPDALRALRPPHAHPATNS
jgi:hypothetical protein